MIIKVKSLNGYSGMAVWPFIFIIEGKENKPDLINHERIHLRQQVEMLLIPFAIIYGIMYLYNLYKYKDKKKAYRNIPFEKEAYDNADNLDYLSTRDLFSWTKYIK